MPQSHQLNNFQIISFDIFDTLIHRHTSAPMDVFDAVRSKLIESELALFHPKLIDNFPELRRNSEQKARQIRVEQFGRDAEITFDEIYDQLVLQYPLSHEFRQLLQNTELSLERLFLYPSQEGMAIYQNAVTQNKKILFISDMYLPTDFLIEILQNLGYEKANKETVFVSAEHRCNKHSGQLYQLIREKLNLNPKTWLHFGDNMHSDVESAKKMGLSAVHAVWATVKNMPRQNTKIADAIPASIIEGIKLPQHKSIYQPQNDYQKLGYEIFAPMIFGYYIWLKRKLDELNPDKILFFARDAYLIQKIHELINPNYHIPSEYIYVSRKSLYPLSLTDYPRWRTGYLINSNVPRTLKNACDNYDIHLADFSLVMAQYKLSADTIITKENCQDALNFFMTCFVNLSETSIKNRQKYINYFLNIVQDHKKIAIIDIGWFGNMQSALSRILQEVKPNHEFFGLYLGLLSRAKQNANNHNMLGYFVDIYQNQQNETFMEQGGVELLEFVLTAPHGSTIGYHQDEQNNITPILEEKNLDEQDYEQKALEVQKGILEFVKNYAFLLEEFPLSALDSLKWTEPFCELVRNPSREQITLLGDLTHSDGTGNNQQRVALAPKLPYFHRLFRTKKYKKAYEMVFWKQGFYYRNQRDPRKYRG